MRVFVPVALVALLVCGAGVAIAQEFLPYQTEGQISPDRVLAERTRLSIILDDNYLPYTPRARYAYDVVTEQIPPERAHASRIEAGTRHLEDYMPFTAATRFAPWEVEGQISPDRVLVERVATGITSF